MKLSIIVAVAEAGVIGLDGLLPWHLPADLARFRRITMGHPLIMGRRTFESIGKPLPGRTSIVLSHRLDFQPAEIQIARSLDEAIEAARRAETLRGAAGQQAEAFVIGGAEVYRQAIPRADRLYITRVHAAVPGDAWFAEPDPGEWHLARWIERQADKKNPYCLTFQHYIRRNDTTCREELEP